MNTALPCRVYRRRRRAAQIAVNRNQIQIKSVEGDLWDQTEVTARFKVLGVRNDFAGGVEGGQRDLEPDQGPATRSDEINVAEQRDADEPG